MASESGEVGLSPFGRPPKDSIWRCSCGFEGHWQRFLGHRRGWKNRPACQGRKVCVNPGTVDGNVPDWVQRWMGEVTGVDPTAPAAEEPTLEAEGFRADAQEPSSEVAKQEPAEDPAELAARLASQRYRMGPYQPAADDLPDLDLGGPDPLPPGEWSVEHPVAPPPPGYIREAITIPAELRVWYNWYVQQGWRVGDRSFSAWIIDMLTDHIQSCHGFGLFVLRTEEVEIAGRNDEQGLQSTLAGDHA